MPTRHPRLTIVIEQDLYETIKKLAKAKKVSMSYLVTQLIREALALKEDLLLSELSEKREKSCERERYLCHKGIWES